MSDRQAAGFVLCRTVLQYFLLVDASCIQMWVYPEPHTAVASIGRTIRAFSYILPAVGYTHVVVVVVVVVAALSGSLSLYLYVHASCDNGDAVLVDTCRVNIWFYPPMLEFFSVIRGSVILYFSLLSKGVCRSTRIVQWCVKVRVYLLDRRLLPRLN